ncbi:MAG: hypothetical protein HYY93_08900 [Planctomycetes bacterium]|nr:hypothetical protein [Planctomycetota bacterium]
MTAFDVKTVGDEVYITGTGDDPPRLVARAMAELQSRGAAPLSIKAYGPSPEFREACRDIEGPVTFLENREGPVGLQVWGIAGGVTTTGSGRMWKANGSRMLHLASIRGAGAGETLQAESMFDRVRETLRTNGLSWGNAARTWIYLARLLDWYGEFNRVRRRHFQEAGVGPDVGFPASTGIQGRSGGGEECQMDLLAVEGLPLRFIRRTPLQNEAISYGSAFSRGAVIERAGHRTVHVSGTASLDAAGRTVHVGDAAAQAIETLRSVEAVLRSEGAGLSDIVSSTLFSRDAATLETCLRATGPLPFPTVPVVAHVCRPDLLGELEAVAVIQD